MSALAGDRHWVDGVGRLALVVGNSRLHWAALTEGEILATWDTEYLDEGAIAQLLPDSSHLSELLQTCPPNLSEALRHLNLQPPLLLASVVPAQTQLWSIYIKSHLITLEQIPLQRLYPNLGVDRALVALGAGHVYGFPVLVIDGGTALTLTGVDGDRQFIGGAILPGLRLQGRSLAHYTAALPEVDVLDPSSPDPIPRWATRTPDAIRSGIFYTVLAGLEEFIRCWLEEHPTSAVVATGGDGVYLSQCLNRRFMERSGGKPEQMPSVLIHSDPVLAFHGMRAIAFL